jgi:hypothetical protein
VPTPSLSFKSEAQTKSKLPWRNKLQCTVSNTTPKTTRASLDFKFIEQYPNTVAPDAFDTTKDEEIFCHRDRAGKRTYPYCR